MLNVNGLNIPIKRQQLISIHVKYSEKRRNRGKRSQLYKEKL